MNHNVAEPDLQTRDNPVGRQGLKVFYLLNSTDSSENYLPFILSSKLLLKALNQIFNHKYIAVYILNCDRYFRTMYNIIS